MRYELRDYQKEASDAAVAFFNDRKAKYNAIEVLPTGCHAKGSKVLMADGTLKKVEDVVVGDLLMGTNSYREVLCLHRGRDMMYRIVPIKGEPFVVNGGHILALYRTPEENGNGGFDEISVRDYLKTNKTYKHQHKLYRTALTEFNVSPTLPLDPYFIGILLGDGSIHGQVGITTMDEEILSYIKSFADVNGYSLRIARKERTDCVTAFFVTHSAGRRSPLRAILENLGLYGCRAADKFIPHIYKVASVKERRALLAGLIDTDGYLHNGYVEYTSKSEALVRDIMFLARSLGLGCTLQKTKVVNEESYYRISINGDLDELPMKVGRRQSEGRKQKKRVLVSGFKVEEVGEDDYYGWTVDGNSLYVDEQFFAQHNSGKSLIVADIAYRLNGNTLVLQPSKEILEQNYNKMLSYGVTDCGIYSASFRRKEIKRITFATIGSITGHEEEFKGFTHIIQDECHLSNNKGGMYKAFFESLGCKILGLTATPYRLASNSEGSMLRFLTRTKPRVFNKVIFHVQIKELLDRGYLSKLNYYDLTPKTFNTNNLVDNSTGADYTDESVEREFKRIDFYIYMVGIIKRLLNPKSGVPRNGIIVFTRFVDEAIQLSRDIPSCAYVSGDMNKKEREKILEDFKNGKIKVLANAAVLVVGFDYPALDTIVLGRPTKSLAYHYQSIGRIIRPSADKEEGWVVDLVGNTKKFGKVEDLRLIEKHPNMWEVQSNGKPLTNVYF